MTDSLKKTISFTTVKELCVICNKRVFATEKSFINNKVYHTDCFRCSKCKTKLNVGSFGQHENLLYCKNHLPITTKKELTPKKLETSKSEVKLEPPKELPEEKKEIPKKVEVQKDTQAPQELIKKTSSFKVLKESCVLCQKQVYLTDKQVMDGKNYHQACLKCTLCKCKLTIGNFTQLDNVPYCKTHYPKGIKKVGLTNTQTPEKKIQELKVEPVVDVKIPEIKQMSVEKPKEEKPKEPQKRRGIKMTIEMDCSFFFNYEGLDLEYYKRLEESNKEPQPRSLKQKIEISSFFFDDNYSLDEDFYQKVKDALYEPKLRQKRSSSQQLDSSFFFNNSQVDTSDYDKYKKAVEDEPVPKERKSQKMGRNVANPDFFFKSVSIDLNDYQGYIDAVDFKEPKLRQGAKKNSVEATFFFNITNFKISEEDYDVYNEYVNEKDAPRPRMRKGAKEISTPQFFFNQKSANDFVDLSQFNDEEIKPPKERLKVSTPTLLVNVKERSEDIPQPRLRQGKKEIQNPTFFFNVKGTENEEKPQELLLPTFSEEEDEDQEPKPRQRKDTEENSPKLRQGSKTQTVDFSFFFNAQLKINLSDYKHFIRAVQDPRKMFSNNDSRNRRSSAPEILNSKHEVVEQMPTPRKRKGTQEIINPTFFFDKTENRVPQLRKQAPTITMDFSFFFKPELEISLNDYDPYLKSLNEDEEPKPRQRRGTKEISTPQFFFGATISKDEDYHVLRESIENPRPRGNSDSEMLSPKKEILVYDDEPKPRKRKGTGDISTPTFFFNIRTHDTDEIMTSPKQEINISDNSSPRSDVSIPTYKFDEEKSEDESIFKLEDPQQEIQAQENISEPKLRKGKHCTVEVSFFFKPVSIQLSDYDNYLESLQEDIPKPRLRQGKKEVTTPTFFFDK